MKLYLVRHAHAGSRSSWTGDDRLRPLSKKGRRQADAVAVELADAGITRLLSSPALRCIETLQPLAEKFDVGIDTDVRLGEGHDATEALELAEELRTAGVRAAVLSSHGDVIPDLLTDLKVAGTRFHSDLTWPKASIWLITSKGDSWRDATYLGGPETHR